MSGHVLLLDAVGTVLDSIVT